MGNSHGLLDVLPLKLPWSCSRLGLFDILGNSYKLQVNSGVENTKISKCRTFFSRNKQPWSCCRDSKKWSNICSWVNVGFLWDEKGPCLWLWLLPEFLSRGVSVFDFIRKDACFGLCAFSWEPMSHFMSDYLTIHERKARNNTHTQQRTKQTWNFRKTCNWLPTNQTLNLKRNAVVVAFRLSMSLSLGVSIRSLGLGPQARQVAKDDIWTRDLNNIQGALQKPPMWVSAH